MRLSGSVLAMRGDEARVVDAFERYLTTRGWKVTREVAGGDTGIERSIEASSVLEQSEGRLEHVRALIDLGATLRRTGRATESRDRLGERMDLGPERRRGPAFANVPVSPTGSFRPDRVTIEWSQK